MITVAGGGTGVGIAALCGGTCDIATASRAAKKKEITTARQRNKTIAASDETVLSGKYPLWRYLYCYTTGKPSGVTANFMKFITGAEGQKIVEEVGYVRVK